jgi:hypothetical protein
MGLHGPLRFLLTNNCIFCELQADVELALRSCKYHVNFISMLDVFVWQISYVEGGRYSVEVNTKILSPNAGYDKYHSWIVLWRTKVGVLTWIPRAKNRSWKVAVQGLDFMAHPLYIHTTCTDILFFRFSSFALLILRNNVWNRSRQFSSPSFTIGQSYDETCVYEMQSVNRRKKKLF